METKRRTQAKDIGMVIGMTDPKEKITISIRPDVLARIRTAVDAGAAKNVSAYIEQAAIAEVDADRAWNVTLQELLDETGGAPTPEELAEIDAVLGPRP